MVLTLMSVFWRKKILIFRPTILIVRELWLNSSKLAYTFEVTVTFVYEAE